MAAGAYKSLTIKIGGDTTKLTSSLRGVNSAIYKTQSELNKLSKAAKIDPGNADLRKLQVGAFAEQATNSVAKIKTLKAGIEELGKVKVLDDNGKETTQTIEELAEGTGDVHLQAEKANQEYSRVNGELENAYKNIKKLSGVDLAEAQRNGNFGMGIRSALAAAGEENREAVMQSLLEIERLEPEWHKALAAKTNYENVSSLVGMNHELASTDVNLKKIVNDFNSIRKEQNLASKSQMGSDKSVLQMDSRMALLTAATTTAAERFRMLDEAAKIDPGNIDVARQRADELSQVIDATSQHAEELRSKIEAYEANGFDAAASDARNLAIEAEEAKAKYEGIENEIADVSQKLVDAGDAATVFGVESSKAGDALDETGGDVGELRARFDELEEARKQALDEMNTTKARSELASMKAELAQDESQVKRLSESFATIRVPSNISYGLKPIDAVIKTLSTGIDTAKDRFSRLNSAAQIKPASIGIAVERIRALREVTEGARQKAEQLQKKMDAYKAAGIDKIARNTKDAATAYELAQKKVNDLNQKLAQTKTAQGQNSAEAKKLEAALAAALKEADTAAAVNEFKELEVQMRENETIAKSLKDSMKISLGGMGAATVQAASQIGQLASQLGSNVIQSSDDIDKSYRNLRKTFEATEGDYQNLYDAAMKYSQTHVTSADTMLNMEAIAAQLGVGIDGGADAIQHFAEVAANLDVATDIDAETIALQMGQIVNVMHDLSNEDPSSITGFADALVRLGNNMPTQESNIMQITQRLSAIGDFAGFSTPQLMGWAAAIASTGQKSEAAASGIATTVTKISQAVSSGGEDLKKWADVAGMSAKKFKKEWQNDPSEALKKVVTGLKNSGDELFATLAGVDVNGVRQTQTLAALAQTVDTVDKSVGMAENAFHGLGDRYGESGDAAREAEKKAEGFSGALAKLKNSAQVLSATFGDAMVGPMQDIAGALQWLTGVVDSWSDDTKKKVVFAAGGFAAFASAWPIISTLGGALKDFASGALSLFVSAAARLIQFFGTLSGGIVELSSKGAALSKVGTAVSGIGKALGAAVTSGSLFLGVFGAIAALVGGAFLIELAKSRAEASQFDSVMDSMKGSVNGLTAEMMYGKEATAEYGDSWRDAKVNMGDFLSGLQEHYRRIGEVRDSTGESIGMLDKYKSIIDEAAGAGDNYAGSMGQLKWAVDGLNEMFGTSYEVADILKGSYEDQTGAVVNLRNEIDNLIAAKKRELQLSAYEEMYTEAYKAQAESEIAYKKARKARREFVKEYAKEHVGDTTVDSGGNLYTMTEADAKNAARQTGTYRELNQAVGETREAYREAAENAQIYSDALDGAADAAAFETSTAYGQREGIIMTTEAMTNAIIANGKWGSTLQEIQPKVKELALGLLNAGVGTRELTELAQNNPDVFANMVEKADGDVNKLVSLIDQWNMKQLEEKYGNITWGDESKTWFIDAEGRRIEWNGSEWEVKQTGVDVDQSQLDSAEAKEEEVQAEAAEGANMDVTTDDSELDETQAKIDSQTDDTKTVTYDTEDSAIDASQSKVDSIENKEVQVSFSVDDGGISEAKGALEQLDNKEIKVSIKADTSGASAITDALSGLSGKPIDVKINADTSGATEITTALASISDKPVNVKINADTSGAQLVAGAINSIPEQKTSHVSISADTSAVSSVTGMLNSIPPVTQATITAVTNGVAAATTRVQKLNEVSFAMKSQKKSYTAVGNAATSSAPASNINSLNSAAGNMGSRAATYSAYGNAANGSAASHVWDLVRAINNLSSKSITVTTNYVNNGSPGKSATGAYIPPNKIPRHAAGIFTKPTLTNIGWVGESGAELYSGNSLVPLTNRKYSMPYIDDISDAVAKKLGGAGTTYNVSIDGAQINDDPAIQAAILNLFDVLQRKGAMNRG